MPSLMLDREPRIFSVVEESFAPGFPHGTRLQRRRQGAALREDPCDTLQRHDLTWQRQRVRHRRGRDEENPWASKLSPDARIRNHYTPRLLIMQKIRCIRQRTAALHQLLSMAEERSRTGGDASLLGTAAGKLPSCLICYDRHCNCTVGGISSYKDESSLQITVP